MSCAELEASPCGAVNLKENTGKKEKRAKKRRGGANESNRVVFFFQAKQTLITPSQRNSTCFFRGSVRHHLFFSY